MELICILFNPIPILTPITSRKKFRLRQPNFSLYNRESFFLDDAVSGKSVWPHTYRLTTIWYTKTQHWQAKLAICTPVCKGLDPPLVCIFLLSFLCVMLIWYCSAFWPWYDFLYGLLQRGIKLPTSHEIMGVTPLERGQLKKHQSYRFWQTDNLHGGDWPCWVQIWPNF